MPISFQADIEQQNRANNVTTSAFFYLMDLSNVELEVNKIIENVEEIAEPIIGIKYIIRDKDNRPPAFQSLQSILGSGDIVKYGFSGQWEIYKDVSNSKTDNGLVYDKRTKKYYQYDSVNGWKPILRSGAIDGGTFS